MGELDALEDDLAMEAAAPGATPAYLQARQGGAAGRRRRRWWGAARHVAAGVGLPGGRRARPVLSAVAQHRQAAGAHSCFFFKLLRTAPTLSLFTPPPQDVDLPEVPQGQQAQAAQAADEFGLPAIPQRT